MGSDEKTASKNGRKRYFDSRKEEMKKVKPLLNLDLWKRVYGNENFKDLLDDLAGEKERIEENPTYDLAECFTDYIEKGDRLDDDGSDCYAFYMALIEELGIDPDTVKDEDVKAKSFDITLPMKDGPFIVSVKPFAPYVAEPWRSEIAKKANEKKVRGKRDDGMRVDPRWHYFVSWAKYWDVILNSNSEYAAKLRERDPEHAKRETPTHFSNAVMKKWLRKS
ncbi:MAG: hypothetical protein KH350_08290 [Collinsella sp.]|nr:hypothetical protein [Collinsella sp.]